MSALGHTLHAATRFVTKRVGWTGKQRILGRGSAIQTDIAFHPTLVIRPNIRRLVGAAQRQNVVVLIGIHVNAEIDLLQVVQADRSLRVGFGTI